MRRSKTISGVVAAILTGVTFVSLTGSAASAATPAPARTSTVTSGSVNSGPNYDHVNPSPACGTDGTDNNTKFVHTARGTTTPVYLPDGQKFGYIQVRVSDVCRTAWAELFFDNGRSTLPGYKVTITIIRLVTDPTVDTFTTSTQLSPTFTGMVEIDGKTSQVAALVRVSTQDKAGPFAITSLTKGCA